MLVQPRGSLEARAHLPVHPPVRGATEPRFAVLLNANARQVNPRLVQSLSRVVPAGALFLSRSELDCRRIIQTILEQDYPVVLTGGGDGTFLGIINELFRQLDGRGRFAGKPAPRLGVLKLGTGNGLAAHVNSSGGARGVLGDVARTRTGRLAAPRRMELLLVDGKRTPFAGLGVDGKLLNDYLWVKEHLGRGALRSLMSGPGGYFSAVTFKTVPHYLTHSTRVECEVLNGPSAPAWRVGPDGRPTGAPIAPGERLFQGRLLMAAAATMPYYGYRIRMFPFAGQRPGMMHLRLGALHPAHVLANLPWLWKGRWFPEGMHDFHATEVHLRFARPMPFQMGGDAAGYRQEVKLAMAAESVELLDFQRSEGG